MVQDARFRGNVNYVQELTGSRLAAAKRGSFAVPVTHMTGPSLPLLCVVLPPQHAAGARVDI